MGVFEFLTVLVVVGLPLVLVYKIVGHAVHRKDTGYGEDDASFMQGLNSSLVRMEKRIEALETILTDRMDTPPPVPRESAEYSSRH